MHDLLPFISCYLEIERDDDELCMIHRPVWTFSEREVVSKRTRGTIHDPVIVPFRCDSRKVNGVNSR